MLKTTNKITTLKFHHHIKKLLPKITATGTSLVLLLFAVNCSPKNDNTPDLTKKEYLINIDVKAMVEHFPPLNGAKIFINDQEVAPGATHRYIVENYNYLIRLRVTGGHEEIMCIRSPSGNTNLYQTQNGTHANIILTNLPNDALIGDQVRLVAYKIPSNFDIEGAKKALRKGTAVYTSPVTFYPVNEGYSQERFDELKNQISHDANDILSQVSSIHGVKGANYDPNKTSGNQRVRLNPDTSNPFHVESGSGIMTWSEIGISHWTPKDAMFEEFYQAMGVRTDIGFSLRHDILNGDRLNQFGRNLMLINYFVDPNTKL